MRVNNMLAFLESQANSWRVKSVIHLTIITAKLTAGLHTHAWASGGGGL
jgi:hypothetical protein